MVVNEKIKIVWICHLSNKQVREKIQFCRYYYRDILGRMIRKTISSKQDYAIWVTNAIIEFEKFNDVDLTIVFPQDGIAGKQQRFEINGIKYICFRSEADSFYSFLKRKLFKKFDWTYKKNRRLVKGIIDELKPDIVHLIGAENPPYSITLLDVPNSIPTITSLQTLMSDPRFKENYPMSEEEYSHYSEIEKKVIVRSDYIAQRSEYIQNLVKTTIKANAIFLKMPLALGVTINTESPKKEYDFVYFARNINKAADYAIEAFGLAHKRHSSITLNICGMCSEPYREQLDKRIQELGIQDKVVFTTERETHEEVMEQIKKSRFALLPLKVDLISGTIREAMASGLPVVTTITPATPELNVDRESVLLSENGDFVGMADNMLKLVESDTLANRLRDNSIRTVSQKYSNQSFMKMWHDGYREVIDNFKNNKPFSDDLVFRK